MPDSGLLVVGDLELDLAARLVTRRGVTLRLSPKAFTLLDALIRARPRALSKAELQELIWPGTFVVEANLANLVSEVRRALEDDPAQPRLLRTVYSYGYAWNGLFASRAPPPAAAAPYWLFVGQSPFALAPGDHVLGRGPESVVPLPSEFVSRLHARLMLDAGHATLTDLGSLNGTFVRGGRVVQTVELHHLDAIRIGPYDLTLSMPFQDARATRPYHAQARVPSDAPAAADAAPDADAGAHSFSSDN